MGKWVMLPMVIYSLNFQLSGDSAPLYVPEMFDQSMNLKHETFRYFIAIS